jgi:hypothetical protein
MSRAMTAWPEALDLALVDEDLLTETVLTAELMVAAGESHGPMTQG